MHLKVLLNEVFLFCCTLRQMAQFVICCCDNFLHPHLILHLLFSACLHQ